MRILSDADDRSRRVEQLIEYVVATGDRDYRRQPQDDPVEHSGSYRCPSETGGDHDAGNDEYLLYGVIEAGGGSYELKSVLSKRYRMT